MGQQSVRQAARKTALDVRTARRVAGAQRERRLDTLAVEVHVALRERDAAVAAIERRAGPRAARNDWRRRPDTPRGRRLVRRRADASRGEPATPARGRRKRSTGELLNDETAE